jgi:hypothetical protein
MELHACAILTLYCMDVPVNKQNILQRIEASLISAYFANITHTTDLAEIAENSTILRWSQISPRKYSGVSEVITQVCLRY